MKAHRRSALQAGRQTRLQPTDRKSAREYRTARCCTRHQGRAHRVLHRLVRTQPLYCRGPLQHLANLAVLAGSLQLLRCRRRRTGIESAPLQRSLRLTLVPSDFHTSNQVRRAHRALIPCRLEHLRSARLGSYQLVFHRGPPRLACVAGSSLQAVRRCYCRCIYRARTTAPAPTADRKAPVAAAIDCGESPFAASLP